MKHVAIKRTKGIRPRSAKMTALYVLRRQLVAQMLTDRPICERCRVAPSVDLHERLRRSGGGDILDVEGIACVCRPCHDWIGLHPAQAIKDGWAVSRWPKPAG
jgi:hypothetical protein